MPINNLANKAGKILKDLISPKLFQYSRDYLDKTY